MSDAAALLKRARMAAGLTQTQLAKRIGTTQTAVARMERQGANPTLATLRRAVAATGNRLEMTTTPLRHRIDVDQIRRNLMLSPTQRLAALEAAQRNMRSLMADARRA